MKLVSLILTFSVLFESCTSYKVLVFNPAFGASHANFLGKISDILIDAGHEVTMLIPVIISSKKDLVGSKKVKIIRLDQDPRVHKIETEGNVDEIMKKSIWKMDSGLTALFTFGRMIEHNKAAAHMCEDIFQNAELIEQLRNEKYDLGISESLFLCGFALFDHIGVNQTINTDSILTNDLVKYGLGEPMGFSYYPGVFSPNNEKMGFMGRVKNIFGTYFLMGFFGHRFYKELEFIQPYYTNGKSWGELISGVAYNFINSNQYLDYPSATLPKTVFVGGMQVNTKKSGIVKLDKEWDDVLSKRKTNVLISFGSNAFSSDMPDNFKSAFLEVFASMPDTTFIWKYEIENATIADHLPNVKLTTWMPQNDLLADDRLTLFVTHGGLGSSVELAYQGKQSVVIPLMADQPRNAHMLTRHGGALQLDKTKLGSSTEIRNAIQTVLNNQSYKVNAEKLAQILENQPYQPKDVVLKYCNFAVQFGAIETLNSFGRHLNIIQFYNIDIVFAAISIILLILFIIVFIVKLTIRFLRCVFARKSKLD